MADNAVILNGKVYKLARRGGSSGPRAWRIGGTPSQPVDPSLPLSEMEWQTWGPQLNSFELIPPGAYGGYLGVDYTINADTRWEGSLLMGPAVVTVDLSGTGGTAAATNCFALSGTMNATRFLYVGRGTKFSKVNPNTWVRVTEASAALAENITSMLYTRTPGGTEEISVGMRASAYRVITAVANAGSNDTHSANASSVINTAMLVGPDRVFGGQDTAAATAATLRGNVLTGSVTMAAPNWNTNATLPGEAVKFNSLGIDGNFVVAATSRGPYTLDPLYNQFRALASETENDALNGMAVGAWSPYGLAVGHRFGTRAMSWGASQSDGPETFAANTSPVGLRMTGIASGQRWQYRAMYNEFTGDTYLCAVRPRQPGDPHGNPLSWYPIRRFVATATNFLGDLGTIDGLNTYPALLGGYGTDIFYAVLGRTARWPDDTAYLYATSGVAYFTESRRAPSLVKDVVAFEFKTVGCAAARTVAVSLSADGTTTALSGTQAWNTSAVTSNGFQRLLPVSDAGVPLSGFSGYNLKPVVTLASNVNSTSPGIEGTFRVLYRPRPRIAKVLTFTVVLDREGRSGQSQREMQTQLLTELGSGPVTLEDPNGNSLYVRVDSVDIEEVADKGNDANTGAGAIWTATFHGWVWPTGSGQ